MSPRSQEASGPSVWVALLSPGFASYVSWSLQYQAGFLVWASVSMQKASLDLSFCLASHPGSGPLSLSATPISLSMRG